MLGYWCISYNFGEYQLFITKNKQDFAFVRKCTGYLGDKVLSQGRIAIEESDLTKFEESKNPKVQILVKAKKEARETRKFDGKSLERILRKIK